VEDPAPLRGLSASDDEHGNEIAETMPNDVVLSEFTHQSQPPVTGTALDVPSDFSRTTPCSDSESPLPLYIDLPPSPASSVTVLDHDFNFGAPTTKHTQISNSRFGYCGASNALATEELTFVERDAEDSPSGSTSLGDAVTQPTSKRMPDSDEALPDTTQSKRVLNRPIQILRPRNSNSNPTKASTSRSPPSTRETSRGNRVSLGPKKASGKSQARSDISTPSSSAKCSRPTEPSASQHVQRRKGIADGNSPLDIAVATTVKNLGSDVQKTTRCVSWEDKGGLYMIGDQNPRQYLLRWLRDQTVMVRIGGGWMELAR
jgi:hypothetical protein